MYTILILTEDFDSRQFLETRLQRRKFQTFSASEPSDVQALLKKYSFNYCICDSQYYLANQTFLNNIQQIVPTLPICLVVNPLEKEKLQDTFPHKSFDFLAKTPSFETFKRFIDETLLPRLEILPSRKDNPSLLTGKSTIIQELNQTILKLSSISSSIHINGASGVGKERVARLIHQMGPRSQHPFIAVNCGAIPKELMESEFFGYQKGSFTGATQNKIGLFQAAHNGTLFLDEIAELPIDMQVKLLRAIQEKSIRPLGHAREIPINVRILSASNQDLKTMVQNKQFREDLFYRIHVIELKMPTLNERKEDLPELVHHILSKLAKNMNMPKASITDDALLQLSHYHFPGNIRELENILERTLALCNNHCITSQDLAFLPVSPKNASQTNPLLPVFDESYDLPEYLEAIEKHTISSILHQYQGNAYLAAKSLGISLETLNKRLNTFQLPCIIE